MRGLDFCTRLRSSDGLRTPADGPGVHLAADLPHAGPAADLAELDEVGTTGQIYHHLRRLTGAGWLHTTARGHHEVPPGRVVPLLVVLSAARP
jgi:hypothetical protein